MKEKTRIEKQLMAKMKEHAESEADRLFNVPRTIIYTKAEELSEQYTSWNGLEDEEKEGAKIQYQQIFVNRLIRRLW